MKVHKQNKFIKGIAIGLCALMLSLNIMGSYTIPAYASTQTDISLTKLLDMSLTKTGIVANSSLLQKLQASILNMLNGTASSYWDYCEANGLDTNDESWSQYLNSDAYTSLGFLLPSWVLQSAYFLDWLFGGDVRGEIMASDVVQSMCGSAVAVQGQEYLLEDETVESIRDMFDGLVFNEAGYTYIKTIGINDINPLWFHLKSNYENFKSFMLSYGGELYVTAYYSTPAVMSSGNDNVFMWDVIKTEALTTKHFYVAHFVEGSTTYNLDIYDTDWNEGVPTEKKSILHDDVYPTTLSEYELLSKESDNNLAYISPWNGITRTDRDYAGYLITPDGRDIRVYATVNDYKLFTVGQQPYYVITDKEYNNSIDNSVAFTGDYIVNKGDSISYDIVQNAIDNSTTVIDESVVNNIVNDNSTTIINNYTYIIGGGDGGDGSGDGSDGIDIGDGIEGFLNGITELLDFVLGLLGDIVSLLTTFLDSALTLLTGLGGQFTGFAELLGDLFKFIPQELIDALSAGIILLVGIAIIKAIKG